MITSISIMIIVLVIMIARYHKHPKRSCHVRKPLSSLSAATQGTARVSFLDFFFYLFWKLWPVLYSTEFARSRCQDLVPWLLQDRPAGEKTILTVFKWLLSVSHLFPNCESSTFLNCDHRKGAMSAEPSPAPSRTSTLPRLFLSPSSFLFSSLSVNVLFSWRKMFQEAPCSHWSKWIVSGISHWFPWHIGWVPKNRSSCTNNHFSTNHLVTLSKPNKT